VTVLAALAVAVPFALFIGVTVADFGWKAAAAMWLGSAAITASIVWGVAVLVGAP
jgi:hypothetical protein